MGIAIEFHLEYKPTISPVVHECLRDTNIFVVVPVGPISISSPVVVDIVVVVHSVVAEAADRGMVLEDRGMVLDG